MSQCFVGLVACCILLRLNGLGGRQETASERTRGKIDELKETAMLRWIVDGVRAADDRQVDTTTVSTKPLYRGFCSRCGSKIHAKTPLNENIISVPAGLLDSANTPSPDVSS
jgi:hypothetical protein